MATLTASDFLAKLRGQKVRIIPKINLETEDGDIVIEADCSGCNNANQPIVYASEQEFPKRWHTPEE